MPRVALRRTVRSGGLRLQAPLLVFLALGVLGACAAERPRAPILPGQDLRDPDPRRRTEAVQHVTQQRERRWLPELIELLDDPDPAVRLVAAGSLRDLTGRETGYRAFAPAAERRAQVRLWRTWYAAKGREATP